MRLINLSISKTIPLLSFLIIASLFFIDLSFISEFTRKQSFFIFPETKLYSNILYAQNTPQKIALYLTPGSLSYTPGTTFTVPVKLDTGTTGINAIQADITYPANLLAVESIDDSGSAFALSVTKTALNGDISIIRGSFTPVKGNNLLIANINFKALASGIAPLEFKESSAAVNGPTDSLTDSPGVTLTLSYPASTSPSPKPSPSPSAAQKSVIKIYAAGTPALKVYPNMRLEIKNPANSRWENIKTFKNIKGNITTRSFQEFTYTYKSQIVPSGIRLRFINDWFNPDIGDRNLIIDKINLDGVDIQSEGDSVYSTGTWSPGNGCGGGFKKSEWLHCNGYFEYR